MSEYATSTAAAIRRDLGYEDEDGIEADSQMEVAFAQLAQHVEMMRTVVSRLEAQLAPVLTPASKKEEAVAVAVSSDPEYSSAMRRRVNSITQTLGRTILDLEELARRVDL